jgi:membrane associated rhomboid family serine protease
VGLLEYYEDNFEEEGTPLQEYPAPRRRSLGTLFLLVFFTLLYVVMFVLSKGWLQPLWEVLWKPFDTGLISRFGGLVVLSGLKDFERWRLVTAAFVHVNMVHFLINSYCIYSLGRAVELYYGTRRMFVLFFTCSVIANIFTVAGSPVPAIHVGTLGGLFGLDGVLLGFALRNRSQLPVKAFRWMIISALVWPVFWIILSLRVEAFKGGVWGLVAGFGAGAVLGLAFEAAVFRQRVKSSHVITVFTLAALALCIISWGSLLSAAAAKEIDSPYVRGQTLADLSLETQVFDKEGFKIPVPKDMSVTRAKKKVDLGQGSWTFCRVSWRGAGPYDEPESLAKSAIADHSLENEAREAHLERHEHRRVGGEDAVFFELSMLSGGRSAVYSQAILIHEEKVYTITLYYPADEKLRSEQAEAILDGFRFIEKQEGE